MMDKRKENTLPKLQILSVGMVYIFENTTALFYKIIYSRIFLKSGNKIISLY